MTKKITLIMLVLLIVSAFVFVSCEQAPAGGGGGKVEEEPADNLVYNGYLDKDDLDTDLVSDGSSIEILPGVGIGGSYGLAVEQQETYGEVAVDLAEKYGPGKSYYVKASFKDNGSTNDADPTAHLSFSIVTTGGYEAGGADYDLEFQYDGEWLPDGEAQERFGYTTNIDGEDIEDGGWHTVSAIVSAEEIARVMAAQDGYYNVEGESTMYKFAIVFLVGDYPEQSGYNYILDNVYIKDLNPDLPVTGKVTPVAPEDPGDEGDEGGEGGEDE